MLDSESVAGEIDAGEAPFRRAQTFAERTEGADVALRALEAYRENRDYERTSEMEAVASRAFASAPQPWSRSRLRASASSPRWSPYRSSAWRTPC